MAESLLTNEQGTLSEKQQDFTAQFYAEINNVIGGDNPNQMLTLLLPGIALTKEDFEYDYKNHAEKGPTVEANESKLANKLYDPFHVSGADNGRMLPHQYKSALDALTPKLNPEIAKSKNALRELLLTKYPYKFNKMSETEINTFQEVFYQLYDEYVAAMKDWSVLQNEKRAEIEKKYSVELKNADTDEEIKAVNIKINNEYLTWFETEAYSSFNFINQKMSKLLSVFSENDMKIIEGILDSGSGAELQEARATLRNLRKLTPDGGYIYPVKFNPTNWFELLDTSFTPVDLLESPTVIYDKLHSLMSRKISLTSKYQALASAVPSEAEVKAAASELEAAKTAVDTAMTSLENAGTAGLADFCKKVTGMVCGICLLPEEAGTDKIISSVVKPYATGNDSLIDSMVSGGKAVASALSGLNSKLNTYTKALEKNAKIRQNQQLAKARDMIKTEIEEIDFEISELSSKAQLAQAMNYNEDVNGNKIPEGYSSFYIRHSKDRKHDESEETITTSTKTTGKGFWLFKKKKTTTTTETHFEEICESESSVIEVGMNVAKVGIEREWFNPGVFVLSDEMYHLTKKPVSNSFDAKNYNPDDYIFPCFPVAMLIARDVTIKVTVKASAMGNKVDTAVSESSNSKGYIFFNSGSGSRTSSTKSVFDEANDEMSIIIKIPTPQVIGFYLENTPADASDPYNASGDMDNIRKFVTAYQDVIAKKTKELEKK
ncbi:hypothetical protein [Ruminococcus flavefaciens]|uniref:hypothetical protein n=1 Tax=Ruminococcus flavefaciens TaxID=1265 RepID=UPI0004BAF753|nr:hypothetical protein [Ruminococcus flavefaciens]